MARATGIWEKFFDTPGASSSDLSWWKDEAVKKVEVLPSETKPVEGELGVNAFGEETIYEGGRWVILRKEKEMVASIDNDYEYNKLMPVKGDTKPDEVADDSLDKAATVLSKWIDENPQDFMLGDPIQVTVKKKDGTYSKRPQIGGEYFEVVRAYTGKRNSLIFVFKPKSVVDFSEMEMSEVDAVKYLGGFKDYLAGCTRDFRETLVDAKEERAKKLEQKKNAEKFKQYESLGFGSF